MNLSKFGIGAVVAAAAVTLAALSAWAAQPGHKHSDSDYLFAHLQARSESHDAVWLESSFADLLPSRQFSVNGGPAAARNSGIVVGRVIDVRAGRGFSHKDDAPKGTVVDFDSEEALWRTVEVSVAVEEAWGRIAGQERVTFAVIIDRGADAGAAVNGLRSLDRVIVSLDRQGRYGYSPALYSISHSGDLFGTVDARGNIKMRAMAHDAGFMKGIDTLAELRAEAAKAPRVIKVDIVDGLPARR